MRATSASAIRLQIETRLAPKISSALTPPTKIVRPLAATGIEPLDNVLRGGLPVGAISELVGPQCSGRTSVAISFIAQITHAAKFCAWIDVSNALDPESAAAAGVDLNRLLWVRCGASVTATVKQSNFTVPDKYFVAPPIKRGLHGGGFGAHPRSEVNGLSDAVGELLKPAATASLQTEPLRHARPERNSPDTLTFAPQSSHAAKPWSHMEQALRATDLLLQAGGFSVIVLDMGSLSPEFVSRIPLATWFRYRAAAERTQSTILLLTQYCCAKSSAELLLQLKSAEPLNDETTVFTGIRPTIQVMRRRFEFAENTGTLPLRKPPESTITASWHSRTTWGICR